jgi:hypothetical protein
MRRRRAYLYLGPVREFTVVFAAIEFEQWEANVHTGRWIISVAATAAIGATAFAAPAQAATAAPAVTHAVAVPLTNPSQGYCNPNEDGQIQLGADRQLYQCRYVSGLGWWWVRY